MKICVATYATGNFAAVCEVTDPNKRQYCERHGYAFERNHVDEPPDDTAFVRHLWHVKLMSSGQWDWLYFLDADALFTNLTIKLESIIQPSDTLIFPIDAVMVQAGGFLAKYCDESLKFFADVLALRYSGLRDQQAMEKILPGYMGLVRTVPQRVMGSYDYGHYHHLGGNYVKGLDRAGNDGQWQKGDFVFHAPGMSIASKVDVLRSKLDRIVVD